MALNVLSLGFFGHQNAGDDLLRSSLEYIFREHRVNFSCWEPSIRSMNEYDLVVVGGGSLWPDFKFFRRPVSELRRIKVPICVLGISAKKNDESISKSSAYLINNADYFHVRDCETKDILGGSEKITVGADLFWWGPWRVTEDSDLLNLPIESNDRVLKICGPKRAAIAFRSANNISWNPDRLISVVRSLGLQPVPFPFYFGSVKHDASADVNDAEFLAKLLGGPVVTHWSISPVVTSDIVLAMRYHAVLVSIRLGKIVIGINCHPKIAAFYGDFGISELCVKPDDPEALSNAMRNVIDHYDDYANKIHVVRSALEVAGAKDYEKFEQFLGAIKPLSRGFFSSF